MKYRMIPHLLLIAAFVLLLLKSQLPMGVHIASAFSFAILVAVHIFMHRKWLSGFKKGKIAKKNKNRLMFFTGMVLLSCTILSITSGVLISDRVLPELTAAIGPQVRSVFVVVHVISANVMLVMALIHLVLNLKRIGRWFGSTKSQSAKQTA